MWEVNWWDALADMRGWMIFVGIVWSIFLVTLVYLVLLAFDRLVGGLKSARISAEAAADSTPAA